MGVSGWQTGKETATSQMQLLSAPSLPEACLGFPPMQDHPSFLGWLCDNDANRLLLHCSLLFSSSHLSSCFVRADFPFADSISLAQKQGGISAHGINRFLWSLAGFGQAAARLLRGCPGHSGALCVTNGCWAWARLVEVVPDTHTLMPWVLEGTVIWKMTFLMRNKTKAASAFPAW